MAFRVDLEHPKSQGRKPTPLRTRLEMLIDRRGPDECWPWLGFISPDGYGRFRPTQDRYVHAHRVVYEEFVGPIPDGLDIDHVKERGCSLRHCMNPAHMEPVTSAENTRRGNGPAGVNARKTACIHSHPFTPENTYLYPDGERACRECRRLADRNRRSAG